MRNLIIAGLMLTTLAVVRPSQALNLTSLNDSETAPLFISDRDMQTVDGIDDQQNLERPLANDLLPENLQLLEDRITVIELPDNL